MTARSSDHYPAVLRARVRRQSDLHWKRALKLKAEASERRRIAREIELFGEPLDLAALSADPGYIYRLAAGRAAAAKHLRDEPATEAQKASRWRKIWGAKS